MVNNQQTQIEALLKRDRAIVLFGLVTISVLAWIYILRMAWGIRNMDMTIGMPHMHTWEAFDLVMVFVMWAVMMVAMMVPSTSPIVLAFAKIYRKRRECDRLLVPTGAFLLGYLVIWTGFSFLVTLAQWGLHSAALLSPMMVSTSPILGGLLLLFAGIFQLTPLKQACLSYCRSPIGFLMSEWREGTQGAFMMGFRHGCYCVGCCWVLMLLLFVTGVMNLLWVAIIAGFVLIEKMFPFGVWVSRVAGLLLIGWGISMLLPSLSL
jgi:predicted metal-binding membrane protein